MVELLTIKQLHAAYGHLHVLHGIDMTVKPGEIVAVIGPNGAGKSTVIKAVFSIAKKISGSVLFNGEDITHLKTHELITKGISYVSQGRINFGTLSVEENLRIGADMFHNEAFVKKHLAVVYKKFPILYERRKKLAYALSGGQQQMLALGRALMQDPKILLLDEPSLGLSPALQKELFAIIKNLAKEDIGIFVVEQNAKKAIEIASRTYLLEMVVLLLLAGKKL